MSSSTKTTSFLSSVIWIVTFQFQKIELSECWKHKLNFFSIYYRSTEKYYIKLLRIYVVALYKIYVSEKLMIAQILPFCHSRNDFSDFATAFMSFSSPNSWGCSKILRIRIKVQFFYEYLKNDDDRKTVNCCHKITIYITVLEKNLFFPQWTFWQIRFTSNWILYSHKERKNMKITIIGKCQHVIIITEKMCGRLFSK